MKRRKASDGFCGVDVGSSLDEQLHELGLVALAGPVQRTLALVVDRIGVDQRPLARQPLAQRRHVLLAHQLEQTVLQMRHRVLCCPVFFLSSFFSRACQKHHSQTCIYEQIMLIFCFIDEAPEEEQSCPRLGDSVSRRVRVLCASD